MSILSGEKFKLRLIPASEIMLHEQSEDTRYNKLIERFKHEKVLFNPLIIGKYNEKYILIDGANRFEALKKSGCKTILAQLVNYKSPQVKLKSWYHFVNGITFDALNRYLKKNNFETKKCTFTFLKEKLSSKLNYVGIVSKSGEAICIKFIKKLPEMLKELCSLNKYYENNFSYHRIDSDFNPDNMNDLSEKDGLLFVYPAFKKDDIVRISMLPEKLPAGITRHLIPNRVLRIKFDIESLKSADNLEQRNEELGKLVKQKIDSKKVRLYKEPILIFDE